MEDGYVTTSSLEFQLIFLFMIYCSFGSNCPSKSKILLYGTALFYSFFFFFNCLAKEKTMLIYQENLRWKIEKAENDWSTLLNVWQGTGDIIRIKKKNDPTSDS